MYKSGSSVDMVLSISVFPVFFKDSFTVSIDSAACIATIDFSFLLHSFMFICFFNYIFINC